jgi:hypothetical protein
MTQQDGTNKIIGALEKLKNETDLTVKSDNIFSLAKKIHVDEEKTNEIDLQNVSYFFSFYRVLYFLFLSALALIFI